MWKPPQIEGFSQSIVGREAPLIGVFGGEGTGKTRLLMTAGEYAAGRNETPGWIVCDRKTRNTVRRVGEELGIQMPLMNKEDFITQADALRMATIDRETQSDQVKSIYAAVFTKILEASVRLGKVPDVNPIIIETGTQVWDYIAYAHFGRKQDVGKSRVWGPVKQDWTDLFDALSHKTVVVSLWERDDYKNDVRTGTTKPDGPPHIGYTTTTLVRLTCDRLRKLKKAGDVGGTDEDGDPIHLTADETYVDRFGLDVYESQDNKALEGQNAVLVGSAITYSNLMAILGCGMEE